MTSDLDRAAKILFESRYVVCLTGAGMSVESGIRPFRGPGGLWTEHGEPPLDGYQRFTRDPRRYWEEMRQKGSVGDALTRAISEAVPHAGHLALAELERLGIIKYLITQNIDNLHLAAASEKVAEIHGNATRLRCINCGKRFEPEEISLDVLPPKCPECDGVIKTDTVMFGEPIPADVLEICQRETERADCMLVVGTSVFVYPAAGFPLEVKHHDGKLVEVNLYETELTPLCDVSIRGKAGEILPDLTEIIASLKKNPSD